MHTHTVFFWLWYTISDEKRKIFREGLEHLVQDPHVQNYTIGEPAKTNRDVVENGYDFAIVVQFNNLNDHDAFQVGKHHDEFLERCKDLWSRVQVFDIESR